MHISWLFQAYVFFYLGIEDNYLKSKLSFLQLQCIKGEIKNESQIIHTEKALLFLLTNLIPYQLCAPLISILMYNYKNYLGISSFYLNCSYLMCKTCFKNEKVESMFQNVILLNSIYLLQEKPKKYPKHRITSGSSHELLFFFGGGGYLPFFDMLHNLTNYRSNALTY